MFTRSRESVLHAHLDRQDPAFYAFSQNWFVTNKTVRRNRMTDCPRTPRQSGIGVGSNLCRSCSHQVHHHQHQHQPDTTIIHHADTTTRITPSLQLLMASGLLMRLLLLLHPLLSAQCASWQTLPLGLPICTHCCPATWPLGQQHAATQIAGYCCRWLRFSAAALPLCAAPCLAGYPVLPSHPATARCNTAAAAQTTENIISRQPISCTAVHYTDTRMQGPLRATARHPRSY